MTPPSEGEPLFERASEYEALLEQGTRLSGEDRLFFVRGRIADLLVHVPPAFAPGRILDYGCGLGDASRLLGEVFPTAHVVGIDTADGALAWATAHHASERVSFANANGLGGQRPFDLCYVSGVLHHVPPERRPDMLAQIRAALRPGGVLALFENNPWNLGARMVMRRIPFDRDAVPISPRGARRLLSSCGFRCVSSRSLFYFPRPLAFLRPLEPLLAHVPLGAQYWLLATT